MVDNILTWVSLNPGWLYAIIAVTAFLESLAIAGIIVPGVALLVGLSFFAGSADASLNTALFAAITGAIIGDGLSFALGRRYRDDILQVWPLSRYPDLTRSGEDFFRRHGGVSVILGRFVGPLRPVIPLIAGSMGMHPTRFLFYNLGSALAWGPFYILPGYLAGQATLGPDAAQLPHFLPGLLLLITGLLAGAGFHWLHSSQWQPDADPQRLSQWRSSTILAVFCLTGFVAWSTMVTLSDWPAEMDQALRRQFLGSQSWISEVFEWLTRLGDPAFLYPVFGSFCLWLVYLRHTREAVILAAAGLAVHASIWSLKLWFGVERPPGGSGLSTLAYPSGHATGATFVYSLIVTQALSPGDRLWQRALITMAASSIFWVAFSRLALDLHWASDVVAGVLLGGFWASLATRVAHQSASDYFNETLTSKTGRWLVISWLAGFGVYVTLF